MADRSPGAAAYLRRLGLAGALPPTVDTLVAVHRRHLETVPYESLGIMVANLTGAPPPSADPGASLERVGAVGRAGYCFHQNGSLEQVLTDLGFDVSRRHGHVWTDEEHRRDTSLNHLVLVVDGLPTVANPDGRWWCDVGLGDCFRDPLPLRPGRFEQDGFVYQISDLREDGWSFRHDARTGSFTGIEVTSLPVDPSAVAAAHAELSTPPDGHFTRIVVVQRRHAQGADTLRGCLLHHYGGDGGHTETELTSYDAWRGALVDELRLPLDDIEPSALEALWRHSWTAHQEWTAAGRP